MKTISRSLASIVVFPIAFNTPLFGWGAIGHMAVAYVAYGQVNPATKGHVNALLKLNPDYKRWLKQIPKVAAKKDQQMMLFYNRGDVARPNQERERIHGRRR